MVRFSLVLLCAIIGILECVTVAAGDPATGFRVDFSLTETRAGRDFPKGWEERGTKWGVPNTSFYIRKDGKTDNGILVVESNKATGAILYEIYRYVDLTKTPIMRWRWRVQELPAGADGRDPEKDDQAISVYVGAGTLIRKSISYRWETETPIGSSGNTTYGSGLVKVTWFCLKNKTIPKGEWVISERNVADDFKKIYGEVPTEFVVSVGGNSQYTQSRGLGEIDFIEFLPVSATGPREMAAVKK